MREQYASNLAFIDLLFNIVVGITFLFLISFIMIKPPTKKDAVLLPKAEYIITMEWPDDADDDVDLWVAGPGNVKVGFSRKEDVYMHLERDDRGISLDTIEVNGVKTFAKGNKEVASIRAIVPGEYLVSGLMYLKNHPLPIPVKVEVIRINPYQQIYTQTYMFESKGEEHQYFAFTLDETGKVIGTRETSESAVDSIVKTNQPRSYAGVGYP